MGFSKTLLTCSGVGVLYGIGIALLLPRALPALKAAARPVAKKAIVGYLSLRDSVKEAVAETGKKLDELVAEAKAERAAASKPTPEPTA